MPSHYHRTDRISWRRWLSFGDDTAFADAGASGELLIAQVRVGITTLLLLIPAYNLALAPLQENVVGFGIAVAALVLAVLVLLIVKNIPSRGWVGLATTALDVSIVSLALCIFLILGTPHTAVNSRVVFDVYFLAIAATCLRYDRRLCLLSGALAILQYGAISLYATSHWELNSATFSPFRYGMFEWSTQVSRFILLFVASVLSMTIVVRAQQLRKVSIVDPLTGVLNRGFFDERMSEEMSRADRYGHPLSIAFIDIDRFKGFNDSYGHSAGDAALRTIATTLKNSVRRSDLVARYGGEEFVILLPETPSHIAEEKLESIRRSVSATVVMLPRQMTPVRLTFSAGVASAPDDGKEMDDLLHSADVRLFEAKRSGRDRVVGPDGVVGQAKPDSPHAGVAK
ncbi:MAG: GGDEF domain-containing protein [Anaerolineae bacterium]|nr:GGDEF domain-containing protein [Gemmatimonadaceae bacterium]